VFAFIDDSGDPGTKFSQGSSQYLVMAACIFADGTAVDQADAVVSGCRTSLGHSHAWEFKFSRADQRTKDAFFASIAPLNFHVRAIVIDKAQLWSSQPIPDARSLKNLAITELLTHTHGTVRDARITIDGKDGKAFNMAESSYFRKTVNDNAPGTITRVRMVDSRKSTMVQLADMIAGAIHRFVRTHGTESAQHMRIIRDKARHPQGSIWHFR
jgi:hypothetical protein